MNKVIWIIVGLIASKLTNEVLYRVFNYDRGGVNIINAALPAIGSSLVFLYFLYKAFYGFAPKPLNSFALSKKTNSGSQLGGNSKYMIGFVAILICLVLFVITLSAKPKIPPSDASASSIGASTNLPAVSTLSDSKDSAELVTQAADKPPEAKEQTSNASSKQSGLGLATGEVLVTGSSGGSTSFSPAQEAWLGNADRTDPAILYRMRSAVPDR